VVLVDDRLDALQPAGLVAHDRHAAAPAADDDRAGVQQEPDDPGLDDPFGAGGGHDAAPVLAVRGDRPLVLLGEALGGLLVVDRPDELRRVIERRVRHRHQRLVDQCGDLPPGQGVLQGLQQPVPDHALGLRAQHVKRIGHAQRRIGGALQRQQPDLRPVAVGEHDLVGVRERRERLHRALGVGLLRRRVGPFAALQQGVAAERDHDPHDAST
jgi:hypothetical protein